MSQFWWVNHSQTARQEIDGQYLWSPKTQKNGARSEFYKNMRRATPGDLVLSFFGQAVRYIGRVAEFAFTAPKPPEFKNTGANWNEEGWLLPVYWAPLLPTVRPSDIIGELGPLLPPRYSPIDPNSGSGRQNAYLASVSHEVFHTIVAGTAFDREALRRGGANSLTFEVVNEILEDVVERRIRDDLQLEDTVKTSVIQARRGQGKFRSNVEAMERSCRLTGVTNPSLLIASHIKPWRLCASAQERLDGMNELLLTPDADHFFDRGFISFEDSGQVLISQRVDKTDLRRLGFEQLVMQSFGFAEAPAVWRTSTFTPPQQAYLAHHREDVFVA
ncbi:HNH endonuclease signature motif containing protein [Mesorhizobium sp. M0589]|uniref:HNH endonuclease n=1 Tax=Mesorhizobium sp. M0589 TaxID=2956965 RepID=UPI0033356FED